VVDHSNDDVYVVALYKHDMNADSIDNSGNYGKKSHNGTSSASKALSMSSDSISHNEGYSSRSWVKNTVKKLHELVGYGIDLSIKRRYSSQLVPPLFNSLNVGSSFVTSKSKQQYMDDVRTCLGYIKDGESYELCLTTQLKKRVNSLDGLGLYLTLREMNPAPYAAWLNFGTEDVCICSSSPERFLRLDQKGILEAKPIKGTIPRGSSTAEDDALKNKLQVRYLSWLQQILSLVAN
jgi:para-aminobenzoate synthetase